MIRGSPSTRWVSLAKACMLSFVRAFAMAASVFATCAAVNSRAYCATVFSTSRCAYQTSRFVLAANSRIAVRYAATAARTAAPRCLAEKPRSRPAATRLTARRLTSHSHGPGWVSSKSLTSNIMLRSGVPKIPKFERWASPQSCTVTPARGVAARSDAMISAAPR